MGGHINAQGGGHIKAQGGGGRHKGRGREQRNVQQGGGFICISCGCPELLQKEWNTFPNLADKENPRAKSKKYQHLLYESSEKYARSTTTITSSHNQQSQHGPAPIHKHHRHQRYFGEQLPWNS